MPTRRAWTIAAAVSLFGAPGEVRAKDRSAATATLAAAADAAVLARFSARPDEPTRSFRAMRHLEVTAAFGRSAWMDARVELEPTGVFRYTVVDAGGSEMLRGRILQRVLRSEQDVYAHGDSARTALTAENYELAPGGRDEHGLVRLIATARRKETGLLNGQFLVTPDTADLVEVSGTLAKAPAFWVPRVDLVKQYQRINGHRVNVRVESLSHVRLLGSSRFTMTTRYETIDGDAIPAEQHRLRQGG